MAADRALQWPDSLWSQLEVIHLVNSFHVEQISYKWITMDQTGRFWFGQFAEEFHGLLRIQIASLVRTHNFTSWSDLRERFPDSPILAGANETLTYNETLGQWRYPEVATDLVGWHSKCSNMLDLLIRCADFNNLQCLPRFQAWVKGVLRPSFAHAGLHPGDRVAALLPNGPEEGVSNRMVFVLHTADVHSICINMSIWHIYAYFKLHVWLLHTSGKCLYSGCTYFVNFFFVFELLKAEPPVWRRRRCFWEAFSAAFALVHWTPSWPGLCLGEKPQIFTLKFAHLSSQELHFALTDLPARALLCLVGKDNLPKDWLISLAAVVEDIKKHVVHVFSRFFHGKYMQIVIFIHLLYVFLFNQTISAVSRLGPFSSVVSSLAEAVARELDLMLPWEKHVFCQHFLSILLDLSMSWYRLLSVNYIFTKSFYLTADTKLSWHSCKHTVFVSEQLFFPRILLHLTGHLASLRLEIHSAHSAVEPQLLVPRDTDVALALHTSGSTRRPKLVPLSHRNLCSGAICIASTLKIQPDDVVMNCLPLFHIHGLAVNVLVPAIAGASSICLSGPFDAVAALQRLGAPPAITLYSAVPSLHQALLGQLIRSPCDFPALRLIRNCSAHLPTALASAISDTFGAEVLPTYAMTESMPIASPSPRGHGTHLSVGFPAGPQVALLDGNVEDLREGLTGEICVKGSCVTRGYEVRDGDPNVDAFVDGWLKTGDLATVSPEGLILSGRCKEIINKAGEKFSPVQIEDVYLQHPSIEDCVAFAAPCEKRGEAIGLAIQSEDFGTKAVNSCNLDSLRMFGRRTQELRVAALPDCVIWIKTLPRTATGKKLRVGLGEILGMPKLHGDHGEWYVEQRDPVDSYSQLSRRYVFHPAPRFEDSSRVEEVDGVDGVDVLAEVRRLAMELTGCELENKTVQTLPLMDLGLDSLSATTFINSLESRLDVQLAGGV